MKRLLSLFLCLCMLCTMSVSVYADTGVTYDITKYVNSYYYETQNVVARIEGSNLIVDVLTLDGDTLRPAVRVTSMNPLLNMPQSSIVLLDEGDYGYTKIIPLTQTETLIEFMDLVNTNLNGQAGVNFAQPTVIVPNWDGTLMFNVGAAYKFNTELLNKYIDVRETDILPVSNLIQEKSNEICAGKKTDIDKAYAIYDWICENIAYNRDSLNSQNALETTNTMPTDVLVGGHAVCLGLSYLFQAMCHAQGIPCRSYSGVMVSDNSGLGHAWNQFYTKGSGGVGTGWYFVDCTGGNQKVLSKGKITDKYAEQHGEYVKKSFFMPDSKFVNDYVAFESINNTTPLILDANGASDWAKPELFDASNKGILYEDSTSSTMLVNYTVPATREYFCNVLARYFWLELVEQAKIKQNCLYTQEIGKAANELLLSYAKTIPSTAKDVRTMGVAFCMGAGIVQGKGDAGFCPDDTITRAEAATMLYRMYNFMKQLGYTDVKFDLTSFANVSSSGYFADHNDIPEWALDGCYGCKEKGVIKGDDYNNFLPNNQLTAEQSVAIFNRILGKVRY